MHPDPIAVAGEQWEQAGWRGADAMMLATSITRVQQIIVARTNQVLAHHGLTLSRFEALAVLRFSRHGALALGKIGARLEVHPASVTNTISKLEADGLVRRSKHPKDGRTVLASITDRGREVLESAADSLADIDYGVAPLDTASLRAVFGQLQPVRFTANEVPSDDGEVPSQDGEVPSPDNEVPSADNEVPSADNEVPSADGAKDAVKDAADAGGIGALRS